MGLLDNLHLKAASLAIAVVLWFVIAGEKTSERGLVIPVELQNFPKDLELTGETANTVEVRLRAAPGIIHALGPSDISAQVDLAGTGAGQRIVHLTPETIRVPFGVRVVKITPSILTMSFERTLQKVVPVKPRITGSPAPGREVSEVVSEPPEVRISGPRSRVQHVENAFTEPISLEGASGDVSETVNVGLEDAMLRLLGSPRVKVTARLSEVQATRVFEGLPVAVRGGAAQPRPAAVRVTVSGPAEALEKLQPGDLHPYVTVGPGAPTNVRVGLDLPQEPAGLKVASIDPPEISLRIPGKRN